MPLFSNKPAAESATWEPQAADGRLAHTAGADPNGVFTSDLSVSEYALLGEAGSSRSASWSDRRSTTSGCRSAAGHRTRSSRCSPRRCTTPGSWRWRGCGPRPIISAQTGSSGSRCSMQIYAWGAGRARVRRHRHGGPGARRIRRPPGSRRPGVHLGPVGAGLLPPAGRRAPCRSPSCWAPASTTSRTSR